MSNFTKGFLIAAGVMSGLLVAALISGPIVKRAK